MSKNDAQPTKAAPRLRIVGKKAPDDATWLMDAMDAALSKDIAAAEPPAPRPPIDRFLLPWVNGNAVSRMLNDLQVTSSSQPQDRRLRLMLEKLQDGTVPHKTRVVVPETLHALERLLDTHPNFAAVTEMMLGQVCLMRSRAARPSRLPPVLLAGDAGIGKTSYTAHLAQALGVPMQMVSMSSATAGFTLTGLDRGWATGREGRVFAALYEGVALNPVFLLDELDKTPAQDKSDPKGVLYPLLERHTAKAFTDEFVGVPLDASFITWVATANDLTDLPAALLSRFKVFHIAPPTRSQMRQVVATQYAAIRQQAPALRRQLPAQVTDALLHLTPRESQAALDVAVGVASRRLQALGCKRIEVTLDDLRLEQGAQVQAFGFV